MFSGAYAGAAAAHRCKYGVLNPTGDARGVVSGGVRTLLKAQGSICAHRLPINMAPHRLIRHPKFHCRSFPSLDPLPQVAAKNYGSSFLVLKDHVRLRVTCASKDTGGGGVALGTPENYAHVLAEFSDTDFRAVLGTLKTGKPAVPGEVSQTYKEMQVHGDILLARWRG